MSVRITFKTRSGRRFERKLELAFSEANQKIDHIDKEQNELKWEYERMLFELWLKRVRLKDCIASKELLPDD